MIDRLYFFPQKTPQKEKTKRRRGFSRKWILHAWNAVEFLGGRVAPGDRKRRTRIIRGERQRSKCSVALAVSDGLCTKNVYFQIHICAFELEYWQRWFTVLKILSLMYTAVEETEIWGKYILWWELLTLLHFQAPISTLLHYIFDL